MKIKTQYKIDSEAELLKLKPKKIIKKIEEANLILETALFNSTKIIEKTVDFAYEFKMEIVDLLENIKISSNDPKAIISLFKKFVDKNNLIYSLTDDEKIDEFLKKDLLNHIT